MSEVQKDPEDVFAGIGFLQFEAKVGEVNFDLAGPIRVKSRRTVPLTKSTTSETQRRLSQRRMCT
jgi:hypothetical protein